MSFPRRESSLLLGLDCRSQAAFSEGSEKSCGVLQDAEKASLPTYV